MLDNDDLTYSYQRRSVNNSPERALITLERSQKLDLLVHLLANLQQSLIVCGPAGIGKSTLLETVRQNRKDLWDVALLQATPNASFESLIVESLRDLKLKTASAFDINALRDACARRKVVLLIDDAGELGPGLLTMLIELADSIPGLRLVFAMNHDQFHIKSGTDKLVEECHFIELPPLSRKQCGEYLQNLSAQPGAVLSFNAITDSLIEQVYRDTHGIPGKILAELPKLAHYQGRKTARTGLWLGIAAIAAGAGYVGFSLLPAGQVPQPLPAPVALPEPAKPVEPAQPATAAEPTPLAPPQPAETEPDTAAPAIPAAEPPAPAPPAASNPAPSQPQIPATVPAAAVAPAEPAPAPAKTETPVAAAPNQAAETATTAPAPAEAPAKPAPTEPAAAKTTVEPAPAPATPATPAAPLKPAERKPGKPISDGGDYDWIMAQPPNNFTLQVMVLSDKTAVTRFLKKYADYRDALTYYPINKGEQEKYVLIYGSFATAAEAQQFKAVMPNEFKQALEKRFRAVQKESRR
ncbi:AAA family ATPase [Methylomonas sp. HW2-6]|uniref:AAA family ATPase n=1 Tax=Methylomonas sp. HW2-6 TaxID=3376687 RepID=UPI0040416A66